MRRMMGYAAAITMLLLPATSCSKAFDDSQWWDELEQIEDDINALKERFNNEINSIKELLDGKIAIRSVETKADGSILVTLTNGSTFTVSPKGAKLPANLITVIENGDGVLCWAKYNSEGEELYNRYGLYSDQYDKEYGQHRDSVADYQANRNHLADMITQSHGMDFDAYTANRDTALAENESGNKIITDNRNYYADLAQQLADSEWGKYVDNESIAAKAIDMYNDTVYKNEQTRLAEAELAEKQRQYNVSLAETKEQNAKELAEQRRDNELNNTEPNSPADYATWDAMDWHYYFSYIREWDGQEEAEAELRAFNRDGFIPQEFQRVAASAVRGGNMGH